LGFNWLFGGLEEYVYITLRTIVIRVLALVAIFLFVRTHEDFRIYALVAALNTMGASVLNVVFVRRHISVRRVDWRKVNVWRHVRPALLTLSLSSVVNISTSLNQVMLGYMTDDAQVGYYCAADRAVKVVVMLVTSMGVVLLPRVSYYIESKKLDEYRLLMARTLRLITFVSFPAAAGFIVLANPLMLVLSGRAFEPAVPLLQIMGLDILWISVGNFVGYQALYSQGKERLLLYSVVLGALCNLGLNWLLIPRWHAVGAAFSTLVAETCVAGARIVFSRDYSNFEWPFRSMFKYAIAALTMAAVVVFLCSFLADSAFVLVICIGVGVTFYVMVVWLLKDSILSAIWDRLTAGAAAAGKANSAGI
jgi:O-antigen/teichoic acid export membrane protein